MNPALALSRSCLLLALLMALASCGGSMERPPEAQRPWERVLADQEQKLEALTAELERAQKCLAARAREENPKLLARLEPPARRPWGYGIVPDITPSLEQKPTTVRRQAYSIAELARWLDRTAGSVADLRAAAAGEPDQALEPLVARFEKLGDTRRLQEEHISYHRFWQQSVIDRPAVYAERNRILAMVREWRRLEAEGECERCERLRDEIARAVAPFRPTPGLEAHLDADGGYVLPVEIATDIDDEAFIENLRAAVAEEFSQSGAALGRGFRIDLEIRHVPSAQLYPDTPPQTGEHLDTMDHMSRFPDGALVITTGAESTHAGTGRYVQLGPHPLTRRVLAHEFAHLLGFDDGYLRAYEGDPDDPYGVVLIEWRGLLDDIMGSPGNGRVSDAMIDQLLAAYHEL